MLTSRELSHRKSTASTAPSQPSVPQTTSQPPSPRCRKCHWQFLKMPAKCSKLKKMFRVAYWMVLATNRMKDNSRYALTEQQARMCREVYDHMDSHSVDSIIVALGELGLYPTREELGELLRDSSTFHVSFYTFTKILEVLKKRWMAERVDDTVEAFIALGGAKDGSGCVAYDILKNVVRDFELGIDIEKFIADNDTDGNGQMDYSEFVTLFNENASWRKKSEYAILLSDEEISALNAMSTRSTSQVKLNERSLSLHASSSSGKLRDLNAVTVSSLPGSAISLNPHSLVTINPTPVVELISNAPATAKQGISSFVSEARRKLQSLTSPLVPVEPALRSPKATQGSKKMFDFVSDAGVTMPAAAVVAGDLTFISKSFPKRTFVNQTTSNHSFGQTAPLAAANAFSLAASKKYGITPKPPSLKDKAKHLPSKKISADEVMEGSVSSMSVVTSATTGLVADTKVTPSSITKDTQKGPTKTAPPVATKVTGGFSSSRPVSRESVRSFSGNGSRPPSRHYVSSERQAIALLPPQFRNVRSMPTHKPKTLIRNSFHPDILDDHETEYGYPHGNPYLQVFSELSPITTFQSLVNRSSHGHSHYTTQGGKAARYLAAANPTSDPSHLPSLAAFVLAQLPPIGIQYNQ